MKTIGLTGFNGAGKDTFGRILKRQLEDFGQRVLLRAFAEGVYSVSQMLFHTPDKSLCDKYPILKDHIMPNRKSVRTIVNSIGMSMRAIDEDVWVNFHVPPASGYNFLIYTDVRFNNEADCCDEIIRITRKNHVESIGDQIQHQVEIHNEGINLMVEDALNYARGIV